MLNDRESRVIEFIRTFRQTHGQLPSARQISHQLGFKSSRSAQNYIEALKDKGALQHREPATTSYVLPGESNENTGFDSVPFVGAIAAGSPVTAFAEEDRAIRVPAGFFGKSDHLFALQVLGNSMSGDHICEGDLAIIKQHNGEYAPDDILAIRVGSDTFTLKRLRFRHNAAELVSSNPEHPTITVNADSVDIAGKFVGLLRRY